MPAPWQGILKKIDDYRWEIPQRSTEETDCLLDLGRRKSDIQQAIHLHWSDEDSAIVAFPVSLIDDDTVLLLGDVTDG